MGRLRISLISWELWLPGSWFLPAGREDDSVGTDFCDDGVVAGFDGCPQPPVLLLLKKRLGTVVATFLSD